MMPPGGTLITRIDPRSWRSGGLLPRRLLLALAGAAVFAAPGAATAVAQTTAAPTALAAEPPHKFSGLVFGDYYYFGAHHDPKWEEQQGFWLRRVYLTFDYNFTPRLTSRVRLEMNSNGKLAGGSLTPYVKDAYLRWTFHGRHQLTFGMQPTLDIDFADAYWGLRHIEKTPLDLYRWDSTRDSGVAVHGVLNDAGTFRYALQVGNDSGTGSETDASKAVRAIVRYEPKAGLVLEGAYAYQARDRNADRTLLQALAGYRGTWGRIGAQYAHQERAAPAGSTTTDLRLDVYSGFVVADLKPRTLSAFARVDRHADPCGDCAAIDYLPIDSSAPFTLVLAGLEYYLHPAVRVSPNLEWVHYGAASPPALQPKDDVVWRATVYWVW